MQDQSSSAEGSSKAFTKQEPLWEQPRIHSQFSSVQTLEASGTTTQGVKVEREEETKNIILRSSPTDVQHPEPRPTESPQQKEYGVQDGRQYVPIKREHNENILLSAPPDTDESDNVSQRGRREFLTAVQIPIIVRKRPLSDAFPEAEASSSGPKKGFRFTTEQKGIMEEYYATYKYPKKILSLEIAHKINVTEKQVRKWFENRRNHERSEQFLREFSEDADSPTSESAPPAEPQQEQTKDVIQEPITPALAPSSPIKVEVKSESQEQPLAGPPPPPPPPLQAAGIMEQKPVLVPQSQFMQVKIEPQNDVVGASKPSGSDLLPSQQQTSTMQSVNTVHVRSTHVQEAFVKPEQPEPTLVAPELVLSEPEPMLIEPEPMLIEPEPMLIEPEPTLVGSEPVSMEPRSSPVVPEPILAVSGPVLLESAGSEPMVQSPRQQEQEQGRDSEDDAGQSEGVLGSNYRPVAPPLRALISTQLQVERNVPRRNDTAGKIKTSGIASKIAPLLRGNSIVKLENVQPFVDLMHDAEDLIDKKIILNALLYTKSQEILKRFMRSEGPNIFRIWIYDAGKDVSSSEASELLIKTITVLRELPFDFKSLKNSRLGRVIKRLSTEYDMPDVAKKAAALKDHWYRMHVGDDPASDMNTDEARPGGSEERTNTGLYITSSEGQVALPRFNKAKASANEDPLTKGMSSLGINPNFFKDLSGGLTSSKPSSEPKSGVRSGLPPSPTPTSTLASTTISTPASTSSLGTTLAPLSIPMRENPASGSVLSVPPSTSPGQSSLSPSLPPTRVPSIGPDTVSLRLSLTPQIHLSGKPRKTVRFRAGLALVSIRTIEARGDIEEEEYDDEHSEISEDMDVGMDSLMYDTSDEYDDPASYTSLRPAFTYSEDEVAELVEGSQWYRPTTIYLEEKADMPVIHSVEDIRQGEREKHVQSAQYPDISLLPSTPAEPDPETALDVGKPVREIPLFEESADLSTVLLKTLTVIAQQLSGRFPIDGGSGGAMENMR